MKFTKLNEDFAHQAAELFISQFALTCSEKSAYRREAFSVPSLAETLLEWAETGASVVAHEDDHVEGFLVGRFISWYGSARALFSPEFAHSVTRQHGGRLISEMYAWINRSGQLEQSSLHVIGTIASDTTTRSALANLEFGVHHIEGVFTGTSPNDARALDKRTQVRAAVAGDLPEIIQLDRQLWEHLARPPISLALDISNYPENNPKYQIPREGAYISVAEHAGRIIGFMSCRMGVQESRTLRDTRVPGINGAFVAPDHRSSDVAQVLLDDIFRWSSRLSAPRITVDFESTNVEGAGFWLSRKFEPLTYSMVRRTRSST